jgi:ferric-dicitrate binding protein FerR (iron transport regulator)
MHSFLLGLLFSFIAVELLCPGPSLAQTPEQWVAKVVSVQGTVQAKRAGETQWQTVKLNDTYGAGDTIRVLDRSRADLALANRPLFRLDQGTTITLKGVKEEKTSIVELIKGAAHFFSRSPKNLEVNTAFVNAGVEGTEFFVRVEEDKTFLSIFEGKVLASNAAGVSS